LHQKLFLHRVATKKLDINFIRVGNSDLLLHFDFAPQKQYIREELAEHGHSRYFDMVYIRADGKVCFRIKNVTVTICPLGYISRLENKS